MALAAFAAATITKAEPMATGFSAVKSGIVIFIVPFVFAFYPELLLIDEAILNPQPSGGEIYLPGYDGQMHLGALGVLLARLILALYLLSSALSSFDRYALPAWEVALRLLLAALVMTSIDAVWIGAIIATIILKIAHNRTGAQPRAI